MVKGSPDLFYACVGTGQVANLQKSIEIGYYYTLGKGRAVGGAKAVSELEGIGTPPYDSAEKVFTYFKWLGHYEGEADRAAQSSFLGKTLFGAPNFSFRDIYERNRGFLQIPTWRLYQEMLNTNLALVGTDFKRRRCDGDFSCQVVLLLTCAIIVPHQSSAPDEPIRGGNHVLHSLRGIERRCGLIL
jgi:hypothetical protein